jgi:hypothetical protein
METRPREVTPRAQNRWVSLNSTRLGGGYRIAATMR